MKNKADFKNEAVLRWRNEPHKTPLVAHPHRSHVPKISLGLVLPVLVALALFGSAPVWADITGIQISKDETVSIGDRKVRHVVGIISGQAERNEPDVPTLEKIVGLKYESDFELWLPASDGNGRFWFSVLNRGNDLGNLRDEILRRGGAYGWCAWQAKNVAEQKPLLKLSGFGGPLPQAYGLVVVRDFIAFLRYSSSKNAVPNPAADQVRFVFAYGVSQSARFMRTYLRYGLNTAPAGKTFDGFLANGGRAGYLDVFRPDSDPGSGGTFSAETVRPPYAWSEVLENTDKDTKLFALNAESEYYEMMAYLSRRGTLPENVRIYEFPLGGHGGGGTVPWDACIPPLSIALEEWVADQRKPPDNRLFVLEKRESPRAKHLPTEPAELPATDELGIAQGGVRLPPVELPLVRYVSNDDKEPMAVPLDKAELTRRYGSPDEYRKKTSAVVDRLIEDRFLPESSHAKYLDDAAKVAW
jgi:hypothetical protein